MSREQLYTEAQGILQMVMNGDARYCSKLIPDESVDMVFTDPVYERMEDYAWLSETAMRVLKPGGSLLCYAGIGYLPEVHDALRGGGLDYRWRLITRPVWAKEFHGKLIVMTQECLWYEKGHAKLHNSVFDYCYSTQKGLYQVGGANWGKGQEPLAYYISALTAPGEVVYDPFCGSGSIPSMCKMLGRSFIASEIDPDVARQAQERVDATPMPLFVVPVEAQSELGAEYEYR